MRTFFFVVLMLLAAAFTLGGCLSMEHPDKGPGAGAILAAWSLAALYHFVCERWPKHDPRFGPSA
jgi:hypothetical protein